MRIDLKNTTFLIPIYLESEDRKANFKIVLSYLYKHFDTNIIVLEYGQSSIGNEIIKKKVHSGFTGSSNLHYEFRQKRDNEIFHRTKYLNEMLFLVKTKVVCNYDTDVLLPPNEYKKCEELILSGQDLVYPYFWGDSQYQVNYNGRDKVDKCLCLGHLKKEDYNVTKSEYGHCQFFNTMSYKEGGAEQEEFISWAPEDAERGYRFKKLGYKVMWSDGFICHLEHTRGENSGQSNPFFQKNIELFEYIKTLSTEQLREYYKNAEYLKQYR